MCLNQKCLYITNLNSVSRGFFQSHISSGAEKVQKFYMLFILIQTTKHYNLCFICIFIFTFEFCKTVIRWSTSTCLLFVFYFAMVLRTTNVVRDTPGWSIGSKNYPSSLKRMNDSPIVDLKTLQENPDYHAPPITKY